MAFFHPLGLYDILKNVFAHTLQVNGAQTNTGKKTDLHCIDKTSK